MSYRVTCDRCGHDVPLPVRQTTNQFLYAGVVVEQPANPLGEFASVRIQRTSAAAPTTVELCVQCAEALDEFLVGAR